MCQSAWFRSRLVIEATFCTVQLAVQVGVLTRLGSCPRRSPVRGAAHFLHFPRGRGVRGLHLRTGAALFEVNIPANRSRPILSPWRGRVPSMGWCEGPRYTLIIAFP